MDKAKILLDVAENLHSLADSVRALCALTSEDLPEEEVKQAPAVTLEMVRGVLADKSRAGHTADVRAIIAKYGAGKLSEIDPSHYEAVLRDAEEL